MHCARSIPAPIPVAEVGEIGFATPVVEPITVEMARAYLHSAEEDDAALTAIVSAARAACERYTNRTLAKRSLELRWAHLGRVLTVSNGPLGSVTSLGYVSTAGTEVLFEAGDYTLEGQLAHATTIRFREQFSAPADIATDRSAPIFLRGIFGPDADTVGPLPADVAQAVLWLTAHFFENRIPVVTGPGATELPLGIERVLRPYRHNAI